MAAFPSPTRQFSSGTILHSAPARTWIKHHPSASASIQSTKKQLVPRLVLCLLKLLPLSLCFSYSTFQGSNCSLLPSIFDLLQALVLLCLLPVSLHHYSSLLHQPVGSQPLSIAYSCTLQLKLPHSLFLVQELCTCS